MCFRLALARPVAKDMTAPKAKMEEKGVVLEGGETGSSDSVLKIAIRTQAVQ